MLQFMGLGDAQGESGPAPLFRRIASDLPTATLQPTQAPLFRPLVSMEEETAQKWRDVEAANRRTEELNREADALTKEARFYNKVTVVLIVGIVAYGIWKARK